MEKSYKMQQKHLPFIWVLDESSLAAAAAVVAASLTASAKDSFLAFFKAIAACAAE